jgi:hypothetical protein
VADTDIHGVASDEDSLDVLRFSSEAKADKKADQRVPLFYMDDEVYTVPRFPHPAVGLRYLKILHEEGDGEAQYYLLTEMLGEDGYEALMDFSEKGRITPDQFDAVMAKALRIVGRQDEPSPKARRNGRPVRRR